MFLNLDNQLLEEALKLVIERSGNEKRIMSPEPGIEPYWYHVVRVTNSLIDSGETDIEILLAAILHDTVEDGQLTEEQITLSFGKKVAEIVMLLTEETYSDHSITHNRSQYFERIDNYPNKVISISAKKIKVVDRYDNLIGLSFTDFHSKKVQYKEEVDLYITQFAIDTGLENLLLAGMKYLDGELSITELPTTFRFR